MVMGAFIPGLRRRYPMHEYVSALLLVLGLILFTLADAQTSPNFSIIGVMMITGALIMDAFLGNLQEAIFTINQDTSQVILSFFFFLFFCRRHHMILIEPFCIILKEREIPFFYSHQRLLILNMTDGDAVLLNSCGIAFSDSTHGFNRRIIWGLEILCSGWALSSSILTYFFKYAH